MRARGHHSLAVGLLVLALALVGAPAAMALFTASVHGGSMTVTSATLAAPTGVKAVQLTCKSNKTPEVKVEWSASSTEGAGYTVERATSSSGPYTEVAGVAASKLSYTDTSASLGYSTTYYYRVSATLHTWSTASSAASVKTLSKTCG
jgi:hypothetical protein